MPDDQLPIDEVLEEEEPPLESEEDVHSDPSDVSEAVVTATDWTTETILRQLARGNIQLNPRFQRRDAWTPTRKSRFIESLFLGLPIPQLVLAEQRGRRGSYLVIDGKQRLLALRQFAAKADDPEFDELRLRGLDVRDDLNGTTLDRLEADPDYQDSLAAFENQTIRTVVVRNWPDEDFLYLVFLRLNTGSVPLAPQELRQALHPGPFVDFAEDYSADSPAVRRALRLKRPDFRMRDVELLIRFFAFANFLPEYDGNLKRFLDRTCMSLNDAWETDEDALRWQAGQCEAAIDATEQIFGPHAFRRWSGQRFESRFNRAVFDIMAFYFRFPEVRDSAVVHSAEVVEAFKEVSSDEDFQDAVQSTTKSIEATHRRLATWGEALSARLNLTLPVPALADNRIRVPE